MRTAATGALLAVHPGGLIQEAIADRGWTQRDAAIDLEISEKHLSMVCCGHSGLSADLAVRIEDVLGLPAIVVMRMYADWQVQEARRDR